MHGLKYTPLSKIYSALSLLSKSNAAGSSKEDGDISPFSALMTAMSGVVGTGNIAGVATAITLGGPGALFYMCLMALIGMATSFTETVCAVKYRIQDASGDYSGGPMFYISRGLKKHYPLCASALAMIYALFGSMSMLSVGNLVQINSIAAVFSAEFGVPKLVTGGIVSLLVGLVILGGIQRIAKVVTSLVPLMIITYIGCGIFILIVKYQEIPHALSLIIQGALYPSALGGGLAGSSVIAAMRYGVSRGAFSNEAGMGTAGIARAAAKTNSPVRQGLVAMLGPFIDTIIVCTVTGLVILTTRGYESGETGAVLTALSFGDVIPKELHVIALTLSVFAFTTMIGYSYYGEKTARYLFGEWIITPYRILWTCAVPIGAVFDLELVWTVAETLMAMIIIPNLIGLIVLSADVFRASDRYWQSKHVLKKKTS